MSVVTHVTMTKIKYFVLYCIDNLNENDINYLSVYIYIILFFADDKALFTTDAISILSQLDNSFT